MKSILDPSFRYTSSVNTDIAKTFARIRRAQREAAKAHAQVRQADAPRTVLTLATKPWMQEWADRREHCRVDAPHVKLLM